MSAQVGGMRDGCPCYRLKEGVQYSIYDEYQKRKAENEKKAAIKTGR